MNANNQSAWEAWYKACHAANGGRALRELLLNFGLKIKTENAAYATCLCPFHKDKNPSAALYDKNTERPNLNCFAGCGNFDLFSAAKRLYNFSTTKETNDFVAQFVGIPHPAAAGYQARHYGNTKPAPQSKVWNPQNNFAGNRPSFNENPTPPWQRATPTRRAAQPITYNTQSKTFEMLAKRFEPQGENAAQSLNLNNAGELPCDTNALELNPENLQQAVEPTAMPEIVLTDFERALLEWRPNLDTATPRNFFVYCVARIKAQQPECATWQKGEIERQARAQAQIEHRKFWDFWQKSQREIAQNDFGDVPF